MSESEIKVKAKFPSKKICLEVFDSIDKFIDEIILPEHRHLLISDDGSNRLDIDEWMDITELENKDDTLTIEVLGTGRMDAQNLLEYLNFCGAEEISGELDWGGGEGGSIYELVDGKIITKKEW